MTATARADVKRVDWRLWVPGVVAPIACFVVDFIAGEYVLSVAPAALLSLAAAGIASLVISRSGRQTLAALCAIGPLWAVGILTLLLAMALAPLSGFGLVLSLMIAWSHPTAIAAAMIALTLLGLTPLWTAFTYLGEARELTRDQAARHGGPKTALFGLAGAATALSLVTTAQLLDTRFVNATIAALDRQALNAYPLCLRNRCRMLVCSRFHQRRTQGVFIWWLDAPTECTLIYE
jgi:hypothetical protein